MEIQFIKTESVATWIKRGMGKVVFDTLKHCKGYYISDANIELFKDAAIKYADSVDNTQANRSHDNVKNRRLAKSYYYWYEELKKMCHSRKEAEFENGVYSSSDGYHLNYNSGFAKKITEVLVGY